MSRRRKHRSYGRRNNRHVRISENRLYRIPSRGRIAGVCAGLAVYFGVRRWMVRCVAITGLLFMPQLIIIAYLLAAVFLPTDTKIAAENHELAERSDEDFEVQKEYTKQREFDDALNKDGGSATLDQRRIRVRKARERLKTIDERIRKLEAYVTSSRFNLDQEFNRMG